MNIWHDIDPAMITPDSYSAVIEISKGSKNKYELDKHTGLLRLDRILYTATHYPANYGFIPLTYADDFDPLDTMVLCSESIRPLTLVQVYPIGVIRMTDAGYPDEKILAIPFADPIYNGYKSVFELPSHVFDEICHFFTVYKQLEDKKTVVDELAGAEDAKQIITRAMENYQKLRRQGNPG
ncbi:MAG: inorganic diphosphatase [Clostridiales bacterium]|nr:inorganic diphosphatase [Clostridiales bacterium]